MTAARDIVVMRALRGVGDVLVAVPALRLLRNSLPEARILLIGVEETRSLVERFAHHRIEFVPFPGWPGIPEQGAADTAACDACRGADAVVQMHGNGTTSNGFCLSLRPRLLVGFGPAVAQGSVDVRTAPYVTATHEVVRCLDVAARAVAALGLRPVPSGTGLEFPLTDRDREEAAIVRASAGVHGHYAVVHPGAHLPDRRWPSERFAAVGRALARKRVTPVVTGGPAELKLAQDTAARIGPTVVCLAGRLSLGGMAALMADARAVLTNDTGMSHVAAAVAAPSVVIFTASDPHRWAPLDGSLHRAVYRLAEPTDPSAVHTPEGQRLVVPAVSDALEALAHLGLAS